MQHGERFFVRRSCYGGLSTFLPKLDCFGIGCTSGIVLGNQVVGGIDGLRSRMREFAGNAEVNLPAHLSEKRPVRDIAQQRMLEAIGLGGRPSLHYDL